MACTTCGSPRRALRIILDLVLFVVVTLPIFLSYTVMRPFHRGFYCTDQSLMYPYHSSTISASVLIGGNIGPLVVIVLVVELVINFTLVGKSIPAPSRRTVCCCRMNNLLWSLYKYIGVYLFGASVCMSLTLLCKQAMGRLRPHFFDVCRPNWTAINCTGYVTDYECTGYKALVFEGRLSFPSGHASFAVYSSVYISLYLLSRFKWKGSVMLNPFLCTVVMCWGIYAGLSRVTDNKHHWSDVLAGSLLGVAVAVGFVFTVTDLYMRPLSRSLEHQISGLDVDTMERARRTYKSEKNPPDGYDTEMHINPVKTCDQIQ